MLSSPVAAGEFTGSAATATPFGLPIPLAVATKVTVPPGYIMNWSGQYESMLRVKERLKLILPLTLLLIFALLFVNTKSAFKATVVTLAVPFSAVGAMWLLWLLGYNMSIAVWVDACCSTAVNPTRRSNSHSVSAVSTCVPDSRNHRASNRERDQRSHCSAQTKHDPSQAPPGFNMRRHSRSAISGSG